MVLLHVQSVNWFVFSLMELVNVASAFSGKIGLKPENEPCAMLNPSLVFSASSGRMSRPPNRLPKMRLFLDILSFAKNASFSGLLWLVARPAALPEAKLPLTS